MNFKICDDVSALGIKVAFLVMHNLDMECYDNLIKEEIARFYLEFTNTVGPEDLEKDKNITGYRRLHEKAGVNEKSVIASPESLMTILFKHKTLRPINYIVDIYNYVAIKNRISIGAHDISKIHGNIRLCFTKGHERFIPLGKNKLQPLSKGEYCYIDDSDEVICRLDYRQCNKTKIGTTTDSCLFIIQGNEYIPEENLEATANELVALLSTKVTNHSITLL